MKKMYTRKSPVSKAACNLAIIVSLLLSFTTSGISQCNVDYPYSAVYNISNTDTAVTDFQIKLVVNTKNLVTAGQMNIAGNDIRFTDAACNNLNYWIEKGMNTDSTIIWVKVNVLTASGITPVKMYWGNATATAASNGATTFESFADFEDGSLSAWTIFGKAKWSIVSFDGSMRLKGSSLVSGAGAGAVNYRGTLGSYIVEADYYNDNSNAMGGPLFEFKDSNNYYAVHSMTAPSNVIMHSKITNGSPNYSTQWKYNHVNNVWYKWSIVKSPVVNTVYFNGDSIGQLPKTFSAGAGVWGYGSSTAVIYFDNVRVRKFSDKVSVTETVLPVTLSSFAGVAKGNTVLITWKTATEQNAARYEIDRSADGKNFSKLTDLSAKGISGSSYNCTDAKPYSGSNYYRLKIIDKDGTASYSSIVQVVFSTTNPTVIVAPNPVVGHTVRLQFANLAKENYLIAVHSSTGQKVHSAKLAIGQENGQQIIQLPASLLPGVYSLKITGKTLVEILPVLIQ